MSKSFRFSINSAKMKTTHLPVWNNAKKRKDVSQREEANQRKGANKKKEAKEIKEQTMARNGANKSMMSKEHVKLERPI